MKPPNKSCQNPRDSLRSRHFDLATHHAEDLQFLRGLYPELNDDRLLELKERLDGYFDVVLETFLEKYSKDNIDQGSAPAHNDIKGRNSLL
jgi:hypothetical protein